MKTLYQRKSQKDHEVIQRFCKQPVGCECNKLQAANLIILFQLKNLRYDTTLEN